METIIGIVLFIVFLAGFMRIDANVIKIAKSLENIERLLSKDKEDK